LCIRNVVGRAKSAKYFSKNRAKYFLSTHRSIWVPKSTKFYAYSKSEDKPEKSAPIKSYS